MLLLILLQVLTPLALLAALALGPARSRATWLTETIVVASYLAAIAIAGMWLVIPWFMVGVYAALFALALTASFRRIRRGTTGPRGRAPRLGLGLPIMVALGAIGLALHGVAGRMAPSMPAIDVVFPMPNAVYQVANGGSNGLVNAHLMTLTGDRFRAYRGQSYGVDFVRVNRWGMRARGLAPSDPADYVIFNDVVSAPCSGTVVAAVDGLPDLRPPEIDRANMAGNHVIVECGTAWLVMAHFRNGSVRVRNGDSVRAGVHIANVGNSGNSNEPHLHIHAQRPGTTAAPLGGDPLSIRFDGRYLARNARVQNASPRNATRIVREP